MTEPAETVSLLGHVKTGDWLHAQTFPPLSYAVSGIVPEGTGLLVGAPKLGKSWLALLILLGVTRGADVMGVPTGEPRPALYLALEDGDRRMQDRSRRLLGGEPIPAGLHYVTDVPPAQAVPLVREWLTHQHRRRPLVVVDTLAKVRTQGHAGESAYDADYRLVGAWKRLTDEFPGVSLLLVHHDRKAGAEDFLARSSGTYGLTGAADFGLFLSRARGEKAGLLEVTGRDVPESSYALTLVDSVRWALDGESLDEARRRASTLQVQTGLGDRSAEMVEYVAKHPEGVTPRDVGGALGISNDDAGRYLRRLVDNGRIDSPKRGVYIPVRSVRVSETDQSFGQSDASDTHREGQS